MAGARDQRQAGAALVQSVPETHLIWRSTLYLGRRRRKGRARGSQARSVPRGASSVPDTA
eukprot:2264490-Rhodomonas_salina.2